MTEMNAILEKKQIKQILFLFNLVEEECNGLTENQKKIKRKLERALKPITVSSRKAKGRGLQKWICYKIANMLRIKYCQGDDDCIIHSREMGQSGKDIILRGLAKELIPFAIECKNSEKLNLTASINQAKANTDENTSWLVVYKKKSLKNPIVIMDWFDFEKIIMKSR